MPGMEYRHVPVHVCTYTHPFHFETKKNLLYCSPHADACTKTMYAILHVSLFSPSLPPSLSLSLFLSLSRIATWLEV